MESEMVSKKKIWTKHFIKIMTVAFAVSITMNMTLTTLPLYAQHLGGDQSLAGFVTAVFTVAALLFRPVFGSLLDSIGRKAVIVIGVFIFTVSLLSYKFTGTVIILLILRFIQGIGFSGHSTAAGTIVADIVPGSRLAEGIGFFGAANTLGAAVGPMIGLYLIQNISYDSLFILAALLAFGGLTTAFFINYEDKTRLKKVNKLFEKTGKTNLNFKNIKKKLLVVEKTALPTASVLIFVALAQGAIVTFVPMYALSKGIENSGLFFTVYAASLLLSRINMGKLADRYGVTPVMIPGLIIIFISLVILAFAQTLTTFIVVAVLYGFGFGTVYPTLQATMIRLCPEGRRGRANATFYSAMDIGIGTGSIIWGFLAEISFTYVYLGAGTGIVISLLFYLFLLRKQIWEEGKSRRG